MANKHRDTRATHANGGLTRREFIKFTVTGASTLAMGGMLSGCVLYRVGKVMVVQSIQDFDSSIPLIAGKRTMVRVFPATYEGADPGTNIIGSVSVFSGTTRLGTAFVRTVGGISSRPLAEIDPDQASHSLDFEIPLRFLTGVDLTVSIDLRDAGSPVVIARGFARLSFTTVTRDEPKLQPVLITTTGYSSTTPTMVDYQTTLNGVLTRLPVPQAHYTLKTPQSWTTNRAMTDSGDFMWLSTDMAWHYFNVVGSDFPTGILRAPPTLPATRTDGIYNSGGAGSVVAFAADGSIVGSAEAEGTFAHEFTHNYGLGHAAGCNSPDDVDSTLPQFTDMSGLDVQTDTILPNGTSELMTYCNFPRWPSSTTYLRVLDQVR